MSIAIAGDPTEFRQALMPEEQSGDISREISLGKMPPYSIDGEPVQAESLIAHCRGEIDPEMIDPNPYQPRRDFDMADIAALAESIGFRLLNTPTVRPHPDQTKFPGRFQVVDGERRKRAIQYRNSKPETYYGAMECIIHHISDHEMLNMALDADVQHKHFNPIERARGFANLLAMGDAQDEIGRRYNLSQSAVSNQIRLLKLPDADTPSTFVARETHWNDVQALVAHGDLSQAHGIELCSLADDPEAARNFAHKAVEGGWTQKALNDEIRAYQEQQAREQTPGLFEPETAPKTSAEDTSNDGYKIGDKVQWNAGNGKWLNGEIVEVGRTLYFVQPSGTTEPKKRKEFKKSSPGVLLAWDGKSKLGAVEPPKESTPTKESTPGASTTPETQSAEMPKCRECGKSESDVQDAGAHMTKFDLCSACDPEHQAAQPTNDEPTSETTAEAKTNAGASSSKSTPASTPSKAEATKPAAPKVPDGFTATFVPTDDTKFIEEKGVSIPAAIGAVRKLVELGEPLGLSLDDMIDTIEDYFNDDDEGETSDESIN